MKLHEFLCWIGIHHWRKLHLGDYMIHNYFGDPTHECGVCQELKEEPGKENN